MLFVLARVLQLGVVFRFFLHLLLLFLFLLLLLLLFLLLFLLLYLLAVEGPLFILCCHIGSRPYNSRPLHIALTNQLQDPVNDWTPLCIDKRSMLSDLVC